MNPPKASVVAIGARTRFCCYLRFTRHLTNDRIDPSSLNAPVLISTHHHRTFPSPGSCIEACPTSQYKYESIGHTILTTNEYGTLFSVSVVLSVLVGGAIGDWSCQCSCSILKRTVSPLSK